MAKNKFYIKGKAVTNDILAADFAAAPAFDRVRVGKLGVFCTSAFRTEFFSYSDIGRAFLRIYEGTAQLCCGALGYNYTSLVLLGTSGEVLREQFTENEAAMRQALAVIGDKAPHISLGAH